MGKAGRRYRVGEFEIYDRWYELKKAGSPIFNPRQATAENTWVAGMLNDKAGLERLLQIWRGNGEGIYLDKGRKRNAVLTDAQSMLAKVERDSENEKQLALNQGRRPPEETREMAKRRLTAEANLDLVMGEIEKLESLLAAATEKKEEVDAGEVLRHGPLGQGKMRNGVIAEMDGQRIARNEKGMFIIDDPRSRYNGMLVHDYTEQIVRPWYKANSVLRRKLKAQVDSGELSANDAPISARAPWPDPPGK